MLVALRIDGIARLSRNSPRYSPSSIRPIPATKLLLERESGVFFNRLKLYADVGIRPHPCRRSEATVSRPRSSATAAPNRVWLGAALGLRKSDGTWAGATRLAGRGDYRDQPAGCARSRRHRPEHARRDRAQSPRGAVAPSGLPRSANGPGEPEHVLRRADRRNEVLAVLY